MYCYEAAIENCMLSVLEGSGTGRLRSKFLLSSRGTIRIRFYIPPPREYQPMSDGGKNMKKGREKRENIREKGKKGKEKG
jgi:hypothetical protein